MSIVDEQNHYNRIPVYDAPLYLAIYWNESSETEKNDKMMTYNDFIT